MTEVMRKRVLKDQADGNVILGVQRMQLVDNLPDNVTAAQVGGIFNQIMTLQ